MTIGVHDFQIPHDSVQPTRDMVVIRIPLPPKTVGDKVKFIVPDVVRDMAQHNVMAGRIVSMGPLAFQYKDGNGLSRQDANIGDWVIIRPFAGTMLQGGKLMANTGYRYVSSFQDVIAIVPADKMPNPDVLVWEDDTEQLNFDYKAPQQPAPTFDVSAPITDEERERRLSGLGGKR